jgi:hypothetical protein
MSQRSKRDAKHVNERLEYTLIQLQNTQEEAEDIKDPQLQTLIKTAVDSTASAKKYLDAKLGIG